MCNHEFARYLDCEDCKSKGVVCPLIVCIACGEGIQNIDTYTYVEKIGLFEKKEK
jgi:hypothetical protein